MDFVVATCNFYKEVRNQVVFSTCICIRLTRKSQDKNRYDGKETCQLSNFSMSSIQPHENFDDHSTANRQNVKNFPSTPLEVR